MSLYEKLGGSAAVDAAVDIFYRKVLLDDRINSFFEGIDMNKQAAKQKAFLTMVFGGPHNYTGKDMREGHKHLKVKKIDCDYLACGFGLIPNSELASILGCELNNGFIKVNDEQESSVSGVYAVGEITGIGGVDKALFEGEKAGLAAAGNPAVSTNSKGVGIFEFVQKLAETFTLREELKRLADSETVFCRCEDVSYGDVCDQPDQRTAKLYTRCGMGACQGKICSAMGQKMFGWSRNKIKSPIIPVDIESMIS